MPYTWLYPKRDPEIAEWVLSVFSLEKEPTIVGNRTRVEILASILTVANRGTLKTHIMYKANLSHRQLEKYLGFLTESGMIAKAVDAEQGVTLYEVTGRGAEFLRDYTRLSQTYGSEILHAD